jgi:ABC-2 type transport system ATP-binding protein
MRKEGKTVVLTTHYIEEAHSLCDRVAIVDHGRVIAIGKPDELIAASKATMRVTIVATGSLDSSLLEALPTVQGVEVADGRAVLKTMDVSHTIIDALKVLNDADNELIDLQIQRPSLEDVFIELTGTSLRD